MKHKLSDTNPSMLIQYWLLKEITKFSDRIYPNVGSSPIPMSSKIVETTNKVSKWLDNCLSRMAKFNLYIFHNVIHLKNVWNRSHMAAIIQRWYNIVSNIKYLKSWVDVTTMLALHRFTCAQKWKELTNVNN